MLLSLLQDLNYLVLALYQLKTIDISYLNKHLDFYTDIGNILSKLELSVTYDPITHTVKVRDSLGYSDIQNHKIVRVLLDQILYL